MALPLALLLAQAGLGAAQGIGGLIAASKNKAPQYTMPGEYQQNLAAAQMRAAGGLPAASRQLAEQQMARGTAAGLTKLQDRNMVATGVAGLAQAQADQANRLAAMDADARLKGDLQVANARVAIAGAKDKQFAIKQQDYLRRAQANSNLMSSGIQNIIGAGQAYSMNDMMKQYYGLGEDSTKATTANITTTKTEPMFGAQPNYGGDFATEGQNFNPTVSANPFTPFSFNPFNPTRPTYRR
jgi:hypothetical protein